MKKHCRNLWKSMGFVLIFSLALGIVPKTVLAQEPTNLIIEVDYMKVKPGQEGTYVTLEQNVWKPIHQERIRKGIIVGWILYQVMYAGADDPYNFVTINVYTNPSNLENPYAGIDFEKIHPGKNITKETENTYNSRTLTRRQLMGRAVYANPGGGESPGPHKYLVANFMKTIPGGNYMSIENEIAKPVSQELINNGVWAGWSVWTNVFPRGTGMESDVVTADYYADLLKTGSVNYMQAFEKVHPQKNWSEFSEKMQKSRNIIRSELWKLIDSAYAGQ